MSVTDTPAPTPSSGADPGTYELSVPLDGTAGAVRENLVDVLQRELVGPAHGDREVIEHPPDVAYLVGRIAPFRLLSSAQSPGSTDDGVDRGDAGEADIDGEARNPDLGDDFDARAGRGVPLTDVDDSAETDEDDVDDAPPRRGMMIPASMGLRFQVPADLDAVTVHASWGSYHAVRPDPSEEPDPGKPARPKRRYQRVPVDVPVRIRLADLTPGATTSYPVADAVVLRVDVHRDRHPAGERLIVEVALCNDREVTRPIPTDAWLFQTRLRVEAGGAGVFLPVADALTDDRDELDDEVRRLNLLYRDRLEFAIGRTCSVDWRAEDPSPRRATEVWTTWLPSAETARVEAQPIERALLDMRRLADAGPAELESGLRPIVAGYGDWLDRQPHRIADLPAHLRVEATESLHEARRVREQLAAGLDHLLTDPEARRCFAFMNRVMADQRVQTQVAARRSAEPTLTRDAARAAVLADGPKAHSWRAFQLAFVLMQLPALTVPDLARRSGELAKVELLFFPTGGGKTEAYLGLAAYTFAVRRRQGVVASVDGALDGGAGVAVLMRYTLRLLTNQQFQRATALVCAAELVRREDEATWGGEPFRIGLWVGTDVSPKRFEEAEEQLRKVSEGSGYRLTVLQVQRCPWCGTPIGSAQVKADRLERRIRVYCGDPFAQCPFAEGGSAEQGLPVLTVDEEIYRLAPTFVIATVDKFARLAREGEAAALFGYVARRCARHGYVHEDSSACALSPTGKHRAENGFPAAGLHPAPRLRPPDLIIQDELHLITGALGTSVGLFEVAIDLLSSWTTAQGAPVRPLVVASSATVRNARDQVKALYGRDVVIFPPPVLDVADTFFAREVEITPQNPGRRYVGVSTTGVRLTTAEIRLADLLLLAGQLLFDRSGPQAGTAADPYMTLVGYFSSTRELAGMARYVTDDIATAMSRGLPWARGLGRRSGSDFGQLNVSELTARVASANISRTLDEMTVEFDPDVDSTAARRHLVEERKAGRAVPARERNPFDIILATSMLQVGVDVSRLGLMMVVGQPKNTAEYIQASSRVGRDVDRPGLVVSLGNWARPRDLAHFEQFRHYHETFYARVEPLSVTPYSVTSIERGLAAVLVSAARVLQANRLGGLSPESGAARVAAERAWLDRLAETITDRGERALGGRDVVRRQLAGALDSWEKRKRQLADRRQDLVYDRVTRPGQQEALFRSAEGVVPADADAVHGPPFVIANSMREVQPEINLLVTPNEDRLFRPEPGGAPSWVMPTRSES